MSVAPDLSVVEPEMAHATEYATRRSSARTKPHLRVVAPLRVERASRGMFVLFTAAFLAVGLLVMLVINTALAQGAFAVTELQKQIQVLSEREQALTQEIALIASPVELETAARELGMVPNGRPVFIDIDAGRVVGKPKATRSAPESTSGAVSVGAEAKKKNRNNDGWSAPIVLSPGAQAPSDRPEPLEAVVVVDE